MCVCFGGDTETSSCVGGGAGGSVGGGWGDVGVTAVCMLLIRFMERGEVGNGFREQLSLIQTPHGVGGPPPPRLFFVG